MKNLLYILAITTLFVSCEKDIDIDLPEYESKLTVEGNIETGQPPIVFLTNSQSFFGETTLDAYENSFVRNATVTVSNGTTTETLTELCTDNLPVGYDTLIADFLGVNVQDLTSVTICAYVGLNPAIFGEEGKTYNLTVTSGSKNLAATTIIPFKNELNSSWFQLSGNLTEHGFMWANMTDFNGVGDNYRWFTKRINQGPDGGDIDKRFLYPIGGTWNDDFIEGQTFDMAFGRPNSDQNNTTDRPGYFAIGDTVVIKFCTTTPEVFEFVHQAETQSFNNGSPFASPANLPTNINGGGLGLWAGYAVTYDTVICQ